MFLRVCRADKRNKKLDIIRKIGWIVVFLLIAAQMFVAVFWEYYDGDDAYYIATAVVTDTPLIHVSAG